MGAHLWEEPVNGWRRGKDGASPLRLEGPGIDSITKTSGAEAGPLARRTTRRLKRHQPGASINTTINSITRRAAARPTAFCAPTASVRLRALRAGTRQIQLCAGATVQQNEVAAIHSAHCPSDNSNNNTNNTSATEYLSQRTTSRTAEASPTVAPHTTLRQAAPPPATSDTPTNPNLPPQVQRTPKPSHA